MRSIGTSSTAMMLARSPSSRRRIDHLRQAAALVLHQHVRQQQRERLVADQFARAPHRVAEPERLLLAGEAGRAGIGQILLEKFELGVLLALEQRHFQLELPVEMILDDALVAAGDEDEMLDAGLAGLVDDDAGSAAGRPPAASPLAWPWSPAGSGCQARRRGRQLCGWVSCGAVRQKEREMASCRTNFAPLRWIIALGRMLRLGR